ncbi:hypothetical protein AMJ96_CH03493 [Rhizobium sp. N113]|uniref:DUF4365 domain-containing protein n=1 Tax=Rhizobium sp. N113 TaxID=1703960 RepID=UPI0007EC091C|nr:DUF4365 domain-containing protein [Rhizobium sp. N113]ANL23167.1 hypothetical protein AMJ96_CH03493 [Rhizobium sp. N113]
MVKKLSAQQIIGRRGAHLFSERVLSAGLSFHETGALDTGIDGFVELRDTETQEVKAQYVSVQIKTQEKGGFVEETDSQFAYRCEQKDLDYWISSNIPVIFVVVHLETGGIWWKSVQEWFSDHSRRASRKIVFNKVGDSLRQASVPELTALVSSFAKPGLIIPASRFDEELTTNLLLMKYPDKVFVGSCDLNYKQVWGYLSDGGRRPPRDWMISGNRMWSFSDLDTRKFEDVIEDGTVEWIGTRDWLRSDGDVTRNQFVALVKNTLWEMVGDQLAFERGKGLLYFKKYDNKAERRYSYQSYQKKTGREVVAAYPKGGEPYYFRHAAFSPDFVEIDEEWYMAIDPTYYFSVDGRREYRRAQDRLSGIKRLETNQSVRGHIGMWKALLIRSDDMLRQDPLHFDDVGAGALGFGVPDDLWRTNEEDDVKKRLAEAQHEFDI